MQAPIVIGELELTEPITDIQLPSRADSAAYSGARLLVRVQRLPVGYVHLASDELAARVVRTRVWEELAPAINAQRVRAGLAALDALPIDGIPIAPELTEELSDPPMVSVVVCTKDRPDSLVSVLRGLTALHYEPYEIVVVDNAPSSEATEQAVLREFGEDPRVRYVRERRLGLSSARNRGLAEATADIVAFTDDDVRVDPWWLDGIVRGFRAAPDVGGVTGLIATAEIENAEQLYFHLREQWGTNCERRVYDLAEHRDDSPLYPYSIGMVGAGANFAISRAVIKEIGGFNEALGAGAPAGGGEDLNMFMRILLSGHSIVYEPSAIVSHVHRATLEALSRADARLRFRVHRRTDRHRAGQPARTTRVAAQGDPRRQAHDAPEQRCAGHPDPAVRADYSGGRRAHHRPLAVPEGASQSQALRRDPVLTR